MKNNRYIILNFLLIIFLSLIVSCDNKKNTYPNNIIPVESMVGNYKILNISDYSSEIKYIPLETNDSVLVSQISHICYENNKILIVDITSSNTTNCYLFDDNGKFIRKIGQRGQGPNDYLLIVKTLIYNNYIFLVDYHKLLIYDINGNIIKNINLRSSEIFEKYYYSWFEIAPLKQDTFVMNIATINGDYPQAILFEISKSEARILKEYPNYVKLDKPSPVINSDELGIMYLFKDNVVIYKGMNDTIFSIDKNMEISDKFIFEMGKYKLPLSFYQVREGFDGLDNSISPLNILESSDYLFFRFSFGNHAPEPFEYETFNGRKVVSKTVNGVFEKRTGQLTLMRQPLKGKLGFKNDIDNGPVIWPHYISSSNEMITYISVEDFINCYNSLDTKSQKITEITNRISLDDNPIVIISKLK